MKVSDNGGVVCFDGIIYRADKVTIKAQHKDGECTFGGFFEVEDDGEIITPKDVSRTLEALDELADWAYDKYRDIYHTALDAYTLIENLLNGVEVTG
jgi:hypothetical protein